MELACDRFGRREITLDDFLDRVDSNGSALEGTLHFGVQEIRQALKALQELDAASFAEEEHLREKLIQSVRSWLAQVPK